MLLNIAHQIDEVVEYTFAWDIRLMAKLPGDKANLLNSDAVRSKVEQKINSLNPDLIVFYDHGSEDALIGADGYPCLDTDNANLLSAREVYTLACLSAKTLGVEAWRKGCKAYWGYVEEFGFTLDELEAFEELAALGLIARLLQGMSWADAKKEVQTKTDAMIDKAMSNGHFEAAMLMRQNTDSLHVWDGETPTESGCTFRRLAIKLFGPKRGWKLLGSL